MLEIGIELLSKTVNKINIRFLTIKQMMELDNVIKIITVQVMVIKESLQSQRRRKILERDCFIHMVKEQGALIFTLDQPPHHAYFPKAKI